MLNSLARRLTAVSSAVCRNALGAPSARTTLCSLSDSVSHHQRDFSLPNASWTQNTRRLYDKYLELSKDGTWKRIASFNSPVHYMGDTPLQQPAVTTRLFTRNLDQDGVGFEYCMFYNKAEKRMICIFQPGPYLEGPPGYTHGGCIATMIDTTIGGGVVFKFGRVFTANLSVNFRNPIPLGTTVLIDSQVDKIEGRKVYTSCQVRSHDGAVVHNDATALFIMVDAYDAKSQSKL
ncbi:acyl-coenzyme A thioesterase THEM4-like [Hyperolius riggenbachi]|uniref:acyl-coenzyme A thioesterase THEM4-like n=1 Tax=Hyperolius riggenbachi TaxID=752182 RepID=UPI0035A2852F